MNIFSYLVSGKESFGICSKATVEVSVSRLSSKLKKAKLITINPSVIDGEVSGSGDKVRIGKPLDKNIFPLEFVGEFSEDNGVAILSGYIQFPNMVRKFIYFWFGLIASMAIFPLLNIFVGDLPNFKQIFVIGAFFILAFIGLKIVKISSVEKYKIWMNTCIKDIVDADS
jgi:hypothetical protein